MIGNIKLIIKKLGITKHKRIRNYIKNLEDNITLKSKREKEEINQINYVIDEKIKHIKRANKITGIFYFGIYFSFISIFFPHIFLLGEIAEIVQMLISFFGTTVFVIGAFFMGKLTELYYQDLNLLTAHIISIYEKNVKDRGEFFEPTNTFDAFISFFKKRGY